MQARPRLAWQRTRKSAWPVQEEIAIAKCRHHAIVSLTYMDQAAALKSTEEPNQQSYPYRIRRSHPRVRPVLRSMLRSHPRVRRRRGRPGRRQPNPAAGSADPGMGRVGALMGTASTARATVRTWIGDALHGTAAGRDALVGQTADLARRSLR